MLVLPERHQGRTAGSGCYIFENNLRTTEKPVANGAGSQIILVVVGNPALQEIACDFGNPVGMAIALKGESSRHFPAEDGILRPAWIRSPAI